jgi:hypothetical protein
VPEPRRTACHQRRRDVPRHRQGHGGPLEFRSGRLRGPRTRARAQSITPSSFREFCDDEFRADIDRYIQSPGYPAEERVKFFKLVWDVIGSEFAGRHSQYEMFYAGAPFITKGYSFRNYCFAEAVAEVEEFVGSYDAVPAEVSAAAEVGAAS